jgi:hypothetical protein
MACADPGEEKRQVTNTGSLNRTVLEFNQKNYEKNKLLSNDVSRHAPLV